jgi:hypothetical protein
MADTDWGAWHDSYSDPASLLAERLRVVQASIEEFLDSRDGALRVISICAGRSLDLLDVLARHPNREGVSARLVELDPELSASARQRAAAAGLANIEVVVADASCTDALVGAVPADLVLACGVFGNLSDRDVQRTVDAMPELCAAGGAVIWTRHTWPPDLTPQIRRWFALAGFVELRFTSPGIESYAVGVNELRVKPRSMPPGKRLFTFIDPLTRPPSRRATQRSPGA